jgi:hypothetical protein
VTATLAKLPDQIQAEHGERIEAELVDYARHFDPNGLAKIAARIRYCYDPDGQLDDLDHRARHRALNLAPRVDGSAKLTGELTAELTELLRTHLDPLAAPRPAIDGVKDPRTAEQRRHDALIDVLKLNLRAQLLPRSGGLTSTIVFTMTQQQYEQRTGLATTGHGALIPVGEAMRISAGEYRLMNVVIDKTKGVTAYSPLHRLNTTNDPQHARRHSGPAGLSQPPRDERSREEPAAARAERACDRAKRGAARGMHPERSQGVLPERRRGGSEQPPGYPPNGSIQNRNPATTSCTTKTRRRKCAEAPSGHRLRWHSEHGMKPSSTASS